ncbi:MAG: hypothetical protein JW863_22300 [Chitinispirillaceae bacterium]|nr:hypothetical protein [Chitinispirillaceae bacterium]
MDTEISKAIERRARHKIINGKQVIVEYREYASIDGKVMICYSAVVVGDPYSLTMEIPKEILLAIQKKFDKDIYSIIPDSFFERIREYTSTAETRIRDANSGKGAFLTPSRLFRKNLIGAD